ncbi:hypothetical protein [Streptomyces sp. wa1063]|uniref:hypothetical protein n=1 Tax=Streptomyces sp. wa1063 TaxID=1828212 RepID=UPI000BF0DB1F|nr:hypothetical protein [Streptomyces sp. wa1063]
MENDHRTASAVGPRCGNNPNVRLSPGDKAAVDKFMAYLRERAATKQLGHVPVTETTAAYGTSEPLMPDATPAVWSDGDPLMEATASAVWEQCRTENSIVVDDPRNIAAVAATVARQLLGTTTSEGVTPSADRRDRYAAAMAMRDGHPEWPVRYEDDERDYRRRADAVMAVADAEQASLRAEAEGLDEALRGAISAFEKDGARLRAELDAAAPAPADRAGTRDRIRRAICEAEGFAWDTDMLEPDEYGEVADAVLAVLADGAAAGVQQTTEGQAELTATLVINRTDSYCDGCRKPTLPRNTHHTDISGWTPEPGGGCGARFTATRSDYRSITADDLKDVRPDLPVATPPAAPAAPEETTP